MNNIRKIILLLNLLLSIFTVLFILMNNNIKVTIMSYDYTGLNFIFLSLFIFIILIAIWPLTKSVTFLSLLFLSCFLFYFFYKLYLCFFYTIEGPITYRFISFMKLATYEDKLNHFMILLQQILNILKNDNSALVTFILNTPNIVQPSAISIMETPLNEISNLVQKNIDIATINFNELLKINTNPNKWNYKKIIAYTISTSLAICLFYYLGQQSLTK